MDYRQRFIQQMTPLALEASRRTGVDPRIIIAQAAVESNYGQSAPGQNYFGIKAPSGSGQNLMTNEFIGGEMRRMSQPFRTYGSMAESVDDYANFINRNKRYEPFRSAKDLDSQLTELQRSGYATAPNYSQVVGNVARGISLPSSEEGRLMSQRQEVAPQPTQEGGLFGLPTNQQAQVAAPQVPPPAPVATPAPAPTPEAPPVYANDFGTALQYFGSMLGLAEAPQPLQGAEADAQRKANEENRRQLAALADAQKAFGALSLLGAPQAQRQTGLLPEQEPQRRITQLPYFRGLI